MIQATLNQTASVGGMSIQGNVVREGDSQIGYSSDPVIAVANAGVLTTRTGNDEGVITLAEGHGITTDDDVDVFWTGGLRYFLGVTDADATTITVGGIGEAGAGDNLPLEDAVVSVAKPVAVNIPAFEGDDIQLIAAGCAQRASVRFLTDAPAVALAVDLAAAEVWSWAVGGGTNPLDSEDVDSLLVSNGDISQTAIIRVGVVLNAQA